MIIRQQLYHCARAPLHFLKLNTKGKLVQMGNVNN
jgi:hypothetical protein